MKNISAIILTFNEALHIKRCIETLVPVCEEIFVIDSFSTDNTRKITEELGVKFYQHKWTNYAEQLNWALDNLPIKTEWVMRVDSDEYLTKELIAEINDKIQHQPNDVNGLMLNRRVYFMDHWIKHGGYYPTYLLRIWRNGYGRCENRWMDEHIKITTGRAVIFAHDLIDDNLNNLTWWTNKHNNYATREAIDLLNIKYNFLQKDGIESSLVSQQDQRKRWLKEKVYNKFPFFIRPFYYFIYRYFFKWGFLDGVPGLIWHFLQGFWYRFLVDAKIYQIEMLARKENKSIKDIIKERYSIEL